MKDKLKIFLSSPVNGLKEERKVLIEALEKKYKPEAMELWVSSPEHPKHVCLERVRNSDAIIILSGPYYGSQDASTGKSFTELEYDEADSYGIDVFHFYKASKSEEEFKSEEASEEIQEKHIAFFNKIWQFRGLGFLNPEELVSKGLAALDEYKNKKQKRLRPFVQAKEYFKDFLKKGHFRHDYSLVGRKESLNRLKLFVESEKKVFVLFGRGGLGKSKILFEFANNIKKYSCKKWKQALFLREIFDINQTTLDDLPSKPCIVILDDAHRYEDLDALLSIFKGNPAADKVKLVLSARPFGREKIDYSISRNIPYENVDMHDLEDLDLDETRKLAHNLLMKKNSRIISIVAEMTRDCPLATVVACDLINKGYINPNAITDKDVFKKVVLDRFLEEFKGEGSGDTQMQRVLEYIAALSPIVPSDNEFRKKLGDVLNITPSEVARKISYLEERGLLMRKGRLVKIVPDLISDHILYKACVNNNDVSTNFADEIISAFHETYLKNILFNISEVEWRANLSSKKIDLLGNAWKQIKDNFKAAPIYIRIKTLDEIEKAAVFQPKHVLEIIRMAINVPPTAILPKDNILSEIEWSNNSVLDKLPRLLRQIAFNISHFEQSCDILWELGKGEKRELNPYPESSLRILQDLAEYGIRKPIIYNEAMLSCVKRWLKQEDAYSYRYSPLDILIQLLAKEGEDTESRAGSFIMKGFPLNFNAIDGLRKESLLILQHHLVSSKPKHIIFKALDLLIDSLSNPPGIFGRQPTEEEYKYLEQEKINILDIIKGAIRTLKSHTLNSVIKKDLRWYQLHGRTDTIKKVVTEVVGSIDEDDIFRIHRSLIGNFREFLEQDRNWNEHKKIVEKETKEVARIILERYKSADNVFSSINQILEEALEYKLSTNPSHALSQIAKEYPEVAIGISNLIIDYPDTELAKCFSSLIWPLRLNKEFRVSIDEIIERALDKKDHWPCLNIAHSFSYGVDQYTDRDYENIKTLLKFNNKDISGALIHSISKIGQKDSDVAFEILLSIDLASSPSIVDNACSVFNSQYGIHLDSLKDEQIEIFLNRLLLINLFRGQHYHVDQLLKYAASRMPGKVIDFLLGRLDYSKKEKVRAKDYVPLPYLGFDCDFFNIKKIENNTAYICKVRDLALEREGLDTFWLPKLFKIVSNSLSEESLNILSDWLGSKEEEKLVAISFLIREADQNFLFSHHEFVGKLISEAHSVSEDCFKGVKSYLFGIAISGGSTRSHGQPSQKNLELKDKGNKTAEKFKYSHAAHSFYKELETYGASQIKEELDRDQEMEYE